MLKFEHSEEHLVAVLVGLLAVPPAEPGKGAGILTSLHVIDVCSIRIAERAADVPKIGSAVVNKCLVLADSRKKEIHSFPGPAVSHSPAATELLILHAIADL